MVVTLVLWACLFMFGAVCESAINCAVYRIKRGMDWVHGRSVCECCGEPLRWWELIPVFSALFLRGRCPRCHSYFGFRHTVLEALCGLSCVVAIKATSYCPILLRVWIIFLVLACFSVFAVIDDKKLV